MVFRDQRKAKRYADIQTQITNVEHVLVSLKEAVPWSNLQWMVLSSTDAILLALGDTNISIRVDAYNDYEVVHDIVKRYVEHVKRKVAVNG
jgi:hypothetical protein